MAYWKVRWKYLAFVAALGITCIAISGLRNLVAPTTKRKFGGEQKVILLWDKFADFHFPGSDLDIFHQLKCPEPKCSLTYDRSELESADAVMFHMRETTRPNQLPDRPLSQQQRWIFVIKEPPVYSYFQPASFDKVFNWTMGYQHNSDIPWPYGVFWARPNKLTKLPDYFRLKAGSKRVAWIVSRCKSDSKREDFVAKLREFLPVDIYGKCGSLTCERSGNKSCEEIVKNYHFYLALENSFCPDYATEKMFKVLSRKDLPAIPIVLGGSDYSSLAPPGSVIDAQSYLNNPKEFAAYLQKITEHRDLYNGFHEWRKTFLVSAWGTPKALCRLCEKLHDKPTEFKSYSGAELSRYWNRSTCKSH